MLCRIVFRLYSIMLFRIRTSAMIYNACSVLSYCLKEIISKRLFLTCAYSTGLGSQNIHHHHAVCSCRDSVLPLDEALHIEAFHFAFIVSQ